MSTNSVFTSYGAFEMKASYQKNMLIGNLSVILLTLTVVSLFWIISLFVTPSVIVPPTHVESDGTLPNLLDQIKIDRSRIKGPKKEIQVRVGAIPNPISDEEFIDDEVPVLVSVDTYAGGDGSDNEIDNTIYNSGGNFDYGSGDDGGIYPGETDFVPFEREPEMYYYKQPDYPRLCKLAGIEGVVTIKVLIGKDGLVIKAKVARSSGVEALDDAALKASKYNKFSPALQNSIPIALWVSYKVTFTIE